MDCAVVFPLKCSTLRLHFPTKMLGSPQKKSLKCSIMLVIERPFSLILNCFKGGLRVTKMIV